MLESLPPGTVTNDAALSDIAVAFDGQTYTDTSNNPSPGNAVRKQVENLYKDLQKIDTIIEGEYLKDDGSIVKDPEWSRSDYLDCKNIEYIEFYMPRKGRWLGFYGGNNEFEYIYLLEEGYNKISVPVNSYYFILYEDKMNIKKILYKKANSIYVDYLRNNGNTKSVKYKAKIKSINRLGLNTSTKEYPEQTLVAYAAAVKAGFDVLLCDVSYTADNIPVCIHDYSINRTARNTDGSKLINTINVNDSTFDELNKYDYGIYAGSKFAGIKLLTLDDFLNFAKAVGVEVYIEIKYMHKRIWGADIVERVKKHGMLNNVSFVSHYRTNYGQMWVPSRILEKERSARVALMTDGNGMSDEYKAALLALKTDRNEVFAFNWSTEKLSEADINWLSANDIAYEVGVIDTESDILKYYNRADIKDVISGIESNKLVPSKIIRDSLLN